MRVVLDTNTIISALLSSKGPPRRLLDDARTQVFGLCSSPVLIAELLEVLSRKKFASRFAQANLTPLGIVADIRRIAILAVPPNVPPVIVNDPDDDHAWPVQWRATRI